MLLISENQMFECNTVPLYQILTKCSKIKLAYDLLNKRKFGAKIFRC